MANELRTQIIGMQGISLAESLLRDASSVSPAVLDSSVKQSVLVGLYQNNKTTDIQNGAVVPVAIGAAQLQDNSFGLQTRGIVREEGIATINPTHVGSPGATQNNLVITVPAGHAWLLKGFNRTMNNAVSYSTGNITLQDATAAQNQFVLFQSTTANVYQQFTFPVLVGPGWQIQFNDFYASITSIDEVLFYNDITL